MIIQGNGPFGPRGGKFVLFANCCRVVEERRNVRGAIHAPRFRFRHDLGSISTPCTNSDRNQEFANKLLVATRIGAGRDNAEGSPKVTK